MDTDTVALPEELNAPSTHSEVPVPQPPSSRRSVLKGAGVVATGLVAGAVGVAALQGHSTVTLTNADNAASAGAGQLGAPPPGFANGGGPGFGGRGGGVTGETRVAGTLSAIGASSITVTLADGTTQVVPVSSSTEIVRNGAQATLSQLVKGESVFVHVIPNGTGTVAERIFAGTTGQGGPGFGPPPGQQQGAPTDTTQGSGTVSTT